MSNPRTLHPTQPTQDFARQADAQDDLARFRNEFYLTPGHVYLDGNSLGLLSRRAEQAVLRVLEDWKRLAIEGWLDGSPAWYFLAEALGKMTAPLLGADAEEVVVTNSTTVNLHQLLATLYRPAGKRTKILIDALSFPSDRYAIVSHLRLYGLDPVEHVSIVPSRDGYCLDEEKIVRAMTEEVAIAVLPSVIYTSGQLLDIQKLTERAHEKGILIGFDCSHSVGALPHALSEWGTDFAFWCTYKYLNSGPGATGGLYLNRCHFGAGPGLAGWFSSHKERQFDMAEELTAADGAAALQIGTPNILSMAPLHGSLEMILEAGIDALRRKSLAMTDYMIALADSELAEFGFSLVTPRHPERRGGHVALAHSEAARICKALKAGGVTPDFRPPSIVRLAPAPLYTSFAECHDAIMRLQCIMRERTYEQFPAGRGLVA